MIQPNGITYSPSLPRIPQIFPGTGMMIASTLPSQISISTSTTQPSRLQLQILITSFSLSSHSLTSHTHFPNAAITKTPAHSNSFLTVTICRHCLFVKCHRLDFNYFAITFSLSKALAITAIRTPPSNKVSASVTAYCTSVTSPVRIPCSVKAVLNTGTA